jgi:hypothetical protein
VSIGAGDRSRQTRVRVAGLGVSDAQARLGL